VKVRPLPGVGVAGAVLVVAVQGAAQVPAGQPLQPLAVTQLEERQTASDLDGNRQVSLTVAEPTAITDLLLVLTRGTRLSFVPDPDITGTFRGDLKNVTLRQAFEMVLQPYGFDYSVEGNIVRVFKRRVETRIFDVNYIGTRRSSSRTAAGSSAVGANGSSAAIQEQDESDLFADVATGIRTLLSPDGKFNLDRKAGLLQVSDYPDRLDKVSLYLDAVHNRATRQISLQARVIEVVLYDQFSGGIDWNLLMRQAGGSVSLPQPAAPGTAGTFAASLNSADSGALLKALSMQGKVDIVASPRVNAMNNEPAFMRVGTQDVFFKTTSQVDSSGHVLQTTVEPQAITEGVMLSVTPQVSGDGMINLSINPSLTQRTGRSVSRQGDTAPVLSVREADTLVRVHENETIVIAGLTKRREVKEQERTPVLGAVPGLGALFRRERPVTRNTDLVILLTPTIMTPARVARSDGQEHESSSEAIR